MCRKRALKCKVERHATPITCLAISRGFIYSRSFGDQIVRFKPEYARQRIVDNCDADKQSQITRTALPDEKYLIAFDCQTTNVCNQDS